MASLTEQATLKVNDQSTAQINKINAALKQLYATAKLLKAVKVDIKINLGNINAAVTAMNRAANAARKMHASLAATGMVKINYAGISQAIAAINRLHAAAAKPIRVPSARAAGAGAAAPGEGGRGGRAGRRGRGDELPPGAVPRVPRESTRSWAHEFRQQLRHDLVQGIASAFKEGAREGTKQADIGETSLALKQLPEPIHKAAQDAIIQLGKEKAALQGGEFWSAGTRTGIFSEAYGTTKSIEGAKHLTSALEELTRVQFAMGQTQEQATDGAYDFVKALHAAGKTQVSTKKEAEDLTAATGKLVKIGDYAPEKLQHSLEWLNQLAPGIGREFTGRFVRNVMKYLGVAKYPISDDALGAVLLLGEDIGTRAAVGYRQAVKQLSGKEVTKEALAGQAKYGLITLEDVPVPGKAGRPTIGAKGRVRPGRTTVKAKLGDEYKKLIQTDLPRAVFEYIGPAAEKAGVDITDPQSIYDFASQIASNSTAIETIASLLYRYQDLKQELQMAHARSGKTSALRAATAGSVRMASQALENQFGSVMGQTVMATAPALNAVMNATSAFMGKVAGEMKEGNWAQVAKDVSAGVAIATPAMLGLKALSSVVGGPVGTIAAMTGLMDPRTRATSGAALSLIGAAEELKAAAAALMAAAVKQGFTPSDIPGGPDKGKPGTGKGAGRSRLGNFIQKGIEAAKSAAPWIYATLLGGGRYIWQGMGMAGRGVAAGARFLGPAGLVGGLMAGAIIAGPDANAKAMMAADALRDAFRRVTTVTNQINLAEKALKDAKTPERRESIRRWIASLQEEKRRLDAEVEQRRIALTQLMPPKAVETTSIKPKSFELPPDTFRKDIPEGKDVTFQTGSFKNITFPTTPVGGIGPDGLPRLPPKVTDVPVKVVEPPEKAPSLVTPGAADKSLFAPTTLESLPGMFDQVFRTGTDAASNAGRSIADAGTSAANSITGAAGSIRQAGADAAASIQAAVSNIHVNVNVSGASGGDTGKQSATMGPH